MTRRRAFLVVLDSVGCGAMPDADLYGDVGANTLGHVAESVGGLNLPNLGLLGLGCASEIAGVACDSNAAGLFGRMAELSVGKDTTTGHWELMGLPVLEPFPTYPSGFPLDVMDRFTEVTGYGWLGNEPASGTEIIDRLGEEHLQTGKLIVYTSADSVFQIAAHEDLVSIDELYRVCEVARTEVLVGDHAVARVIARPFVGDSTGGFIRTARRHDYSVVPWGPTALDVLRDHGVPTYAVGKISDIFAGRGVALSHPTASNDQGMDEVLTLSRTVDQGLVFVNLVDFDMVWGHRRDPVAYARGLERADSRLGELISELREDDLLIVTADHGCDPTQPGSDHTREYVPIVATTGAALSNGLTGLSVGTRSTFSDVAATILGWFGLCGATDSAAPNGYGWAGESILANTDFEVLPKVERFQLPSEVAHARDLLSPALARGEELFLVGGLVRDALRGQVADNPDLDIALVGDLSELLARLDQSGVARILARNDSLRTARVQDASSGLEIDLAETRAESYGRNTAYPDRTVAAPLEWDLARRDYTVNAIALPLDRPAPDDTFTVDDLVDPFGGAADVSARVLRVLHDGSFDDDPTRILRGLRFAHRLGFTMEPHTADLAAKAVADGAMNRVIDSQMSRELALLAAEWKG